MQPVTRSTEKNSAEIYEDIFCFFGKMTPDGYLTKIAGKLFEKTDFDPLPFIGQKFSETVYWQAAPHIPDRLQNAVAEAAAGKKVKIEIEFRVNAKTTALVELSLIPHLETRSKVSEISFFAYDITEREKEIAFHKRRGEQLLYAAESAEIGLWFWDLQKNRIISTPRCNAIFDLPPHDEITLDLFTKLLHPEDTERVLESLRNSRVNDTEYDTEYRIICQDGLIHWVAAQGKTFYDEQKNPVTMTGMVRRVTEKRLAAQKTEKTLESERKAHEIAESANRSKDYFIAFVSHELRSPLNSILGWTKILLTKTVDDNTRRKALETIERSAKTQAKLIEDLVDSARVASGKLKLELRPLNLYDVLENSYQSHLPNAQSRQIKLTFKFDTTHAEVYGDPMRLQQIFTNLLTNALKFTPPDGEISINFETPATQAVVTVTDTGQGISPEFLPRIFTQFVQAESDQSRDRTGLGLGLTIVKTLVEKQGGTVKAESEGLGKGARFTVALPLISPTVHEKSEITSVSEPNESDIAGKRILIVDDDSDSRLLLQLFLEQNGAEVIKAESASSAMKILNNAKTPPTDLIISDIGMPGEDGLTLIKKVRQSRKKSINKIPAIALSAFPLGTNKEPAIEAGFDKYHEKPFDSDLLLKEIARSINRK